MTDVPTLHWPVPSGFPLWNHGEIHVWCAWLDEPSLGFEAAVHSLCAGERARARAFHFDHDRDRFVASRTILRQLLGAYLDHDPATLVFNYGLLGKPALAPPFISWEFNLSHAGPLGLFAVTRGRPVGVDLEPVKDLADLPMLEKQIFPPADLARQQALPGEERRGAFFRRWTEFEAVGKARGVGLDLDAPFSTAHPSSFRLEAIEPCAGYTGAVATSGLAPRLRLFRWTKTALATRGSHTAVTAA
ncbi:MAG: phosphopantetheine-protein transferase [Verrucomicrobia bacterium]|nr:phosphopantetheine-protein transferase [Verrucomicrobiota bacterium]